MAAWVAFPELQREQLPRLLELPDLLWRDGVEGLPPRWSPAVWSLAVVGGVG